MLIESFELNISERFLNDLLNSGSTLSGLLYKLFTKGSMGVKKLETALLGYHWFEGGAPDLSHLKIEDAVVDQQTLVGTMRLEYLVQKTFGCADRQAQQTEKQQWSFLVKSSPLTILFRGPSVEERVDDI